MASGRKACLSPASRIPPRADRFFPIMTLPSTTPRKESPQHFYNREGLLLRLQAFVIVRNKDRRVACLRIEGYDGWMLPGETVLPNESPHDAAARIGKTWFVSPAKTRLVDVQSYPDTDDGRWYMLFIYEADEPAGGLKGTPDTREIAWAPVGKAPGTFAMDHADVFARLAP